MDIYFLPRPKSVENLSFEKHFKLDKETRVIMSNLELASRLELLLKSLGDVVPLKLKIELLDAETIKDDYKTGYFLYFTNDEKISEDFSNYYLDILEGCEKQGYRLAINEKEAYACAKSVAGIFNAFWTLLQAIKHQVTNKKEGDDEDSIPLPLMDMEDYPDLDMRAVQIHLKTQLHHFEYIKEHIKLLASIKVNTILWEWEDKLPFKESLELRHPLAFSEAQAKELVDLCENLGIETIPLVQTYGHLEFVLKHDKYKHLKEVFDQPYEEDDTKTLDICALHPETIPLLREMMASMAKFHPLSRYLHIGGDEVYKMGTCEKCKKFVEENGDGDPKKGMSKLYVEHMNRVIELVKELDKIPMIWHDYLLKYSACLDELDKDVVIVYWRYGKDKVNENFTEEIDMFKSKGFKVLAASSVRSTFHVGPPQYAVRFHNIHELHKALLHKPENTVGALATSWAMPMIPMEPAVPGVLFFGERAWTVDYGELIKSKLDDLTRQSLDAFFLMPFDKIEKHAELFWVIEQSTGPLRSIREPEKIKKLLEDAKEAWRSVRWDVTAGKDVIENVHVGLRMQAYKVKLIELYYQKFKKLEDFANGTGEFPKLSELEKISTFIGDLLSEFREFRDFVSALWEKVIHPEEVEQQLTDHYDQVIELLEGTDKGLVKIQRVLNMSVLKFKKFPTTMFLDDFIVDMLNYKNQTSDLPNLDEMESFLEKSSEVMDYLKKTQNIVQKLHDTIDDFMLDNFLALERKLYRFM
ncbi:MAG: family 20 glycosylhydrolase [Candidatus Hodarchaeota archaeon]